MSILKILQLSKENLYDKSTSLRQLSKEVTDFGSEFQKNIENVLDTFYSWKIAVGLSAPQVGIQERFTVINLDKSKPEETLVIVNPEIQSESGKKDIKKETCLSVPNFRGKVERRYKINIIYNDRYGVKQRLGAEGFLARVIMHEIDHLDGILFIDRMKPETELEPVETKWE